jgi:soluble lytic murein transglycosylase-like protein
VRRVWQQFSGSITDWAHGFGVPAELIVATICTETRGDPAAVREEPGYVSDEQTPAKVSPGLMQTLISTARHTLGDDSIDRQWLLVPDNAIRAGTAYIAMQWKASHFDPPKVACAYNAGGIYYNASAENRWKLRQYPINTAEHADRFVKWFNECFLMFETDDVRPPVSFCHHLA